VAETGRSETSEMTDISLHSFFIRREVVLVMFDLLNGACLLNRFEFPKAGRVALALEVDFPVKKCINPSGLSELRVGSNTRWH
jgi:hypothetical protein